MLIKLHRTESVKLVLDSIKQLEFKENISISTDDINFKTISPDKSPITLRSDLTVYIRSKDRNFGEIYLNDVIFLEDLPDNYSNSSISTDYIKSINIEDNKLIIIDSSNNSVEKEISSTLSKTDSPVINNITIYTGQKKKLPIENYNSNLLYNTNSEKIEIKSDGIYIKPVYINNYTETFEIVIYATEQGKIISNPCYFTITVINLEKQTQDIGFNFVKGRIFTIDNIKEDDIVSYSGFEINLD